MFRFALLLAFVPAIFATEGVSSCGGEFNFPHSVDIVGCDKAPCTMVRGETGVTFINFTVPHDIESFEPTVKATVIGIVTDYVLPDDVRVGCNWLQEEGESTSCPLAAGTTIYYKLEQTVDPTAPTLFSPELRFNIVDQAKNSIACYKWTAKIV